MKTKAKHEVEIQLMTLVSGVYLTEYKKYRCNTLFDRVRFKTDESKCGILIINLIGLGFYPKFILPTLELTVPVCHVWCLDNDILC